MTLTTTLTACAHCGQPASYQTTDDRPVERCEGCAIRYGYERHGEAYTAMKTLGFAISMLRGAGVSDDQIVAIAREILTSPHSVGEYAIGGDEHLPGPDQVADRPWTHGHIPLPNEVVS